MPCAEVSRSSIINGYSLRFMCEDSVLTVYTPSLVSEVEICWVKERRNTQFLPANHRCCIVTAVHAGSSCFRALVVFRELMWANFRKVPVPSQHCSTTTLSLYLIIICDDMKYEIINLYWLGSKSAFVCVGETYLSLLYDSAILVLIKHTNPFYVWCVCRHACLHHYFH